MKSVGRDSTTYGPGKSGKMNWNLIGLKNEFSIELGKLHLVRKSFLNSSKPVHFRGGKWLQENMFKEQISLGTIIYKADSSKNREGFDKIKDR